MDGDNFNVSTVEPDGASIAAGPGQPERQWLATMKAEERRAFALLRTCRLIGAGDLFRAAWPGRPVPNPGVRDRALEVLVSGLNRRLLPHYHAAAPGTFPATWELQSMQPARRFVFDDNPYRDFDPAEVRDDLRPLLVA